MSFLARVRQSTSTGFKSTHTGKAEGSAQGTNVTVKPVEEKSITIGATVSRSSHGQVINPAWTERAAVKDGVLASVWVYAAIRKIATAAASVPWLTERRIGDDEWEPVSEVSPLTDLIQSPNEHWSRQDLIERATYHLYLTGNALFTKIKVAGKTKELWLITPDRLRPVLDRNDIIRYYQFKDIPNRRVEVEDVIHMMFTNPDPDSPWWGLAPLQVLARTVNSDKQATDWQKASFGNRAVPSGVISAKNILSTEQYETARSRIDAQQTGPEHARRILLLGADSKWQSISMSPVDMDFMNSRKFAREEILAVHGVPLPVVGLYENATLANIETARRIFWEETVVPLLDHFKESFNRGLSPEFGDNIRLTYDLSQIPAMRDMLISSMDAATKLHNMGVPFNDINRRLSLGFDEISGGSTGFLPSSTVAIGDVATGTEDPNTFDQSEVMPDGDIAPLPEDGDA